jgi:hypothetical protein
MLSTRFHCESLHILHVLIETTQFLIHGRCFPHPFRDHGIGSQDHEEMAECGPKILAPVHDRSRTPAMRQMLVEKLRDALFVKVLRVQSALAHPPAKVDKAAEVASLGRWCIAVVAEIPLLDTYVRRQRAGEQLIGWYAGKLSGCSHRGLLKPLTLLQKTGKLCEVPARQLSPQISNGATITECISPNFT